MDSKKQNKGKSASSSVTNIAIRFHADDEELEQVVQPNDDTNHQTETSSKQDTAEDDLTALSSSSQLSTPTSSQSDLLGTSASSSVLGRLGKRSASLESATPSETSSGDAWRLFREVRGRITKTVEEKIEEIKSDRLKNNKNKQKSKLGTKVEHSSISDSEDQSESSCSLKVSDNSLVTSSEKKDCDNNTKKNDNQQSDSGRSTPLICSSSSEKDDLPSMDNVQNSKTDEEKKKDKNESKENDNKNGKKRDRFSFCEEEKPVLEGKEKSDDDPSCKKEKKVKRFHFRERFQGSPDKKKNEISIKFSSLKDVESDDEKECVNVEYGQEASETIIEPVNIQKVPVVETPVPSVSLISKITTLLWAWRYSLFMALLAIVHYLWPANYMLGFFVGSFITIQVTSAITWVQESFQFRQSPSGQDFTEGNSIYNGLTYPIFASSRYFTPHENPEKIVYEGWMNEFSQQYSPGSYHISLTDTVQIKLEGSLLTLSNPSTKIPKRAQCNEPEHKKLFNRQRLFDIAGCKVQLLPVGLTHKRIWSKKYPVCITLLKMSKMGVRYRTKGKITIDDDQVWLDPEVDAQTPVEMNDPQEIFAMDPLEPIGTSENKFDDKNSDYDKSQAKEETSFCIDDPLKENAKLSGTGNDSANEEDDDDEDFVRISPSLLNEFCLYLFARCDREKEIWFRRLVAATGFQNDSPTIKEKETSGIIIEGESNADKENKEKQQQQNTSECLEEKPESISPSAVRCNTEQQYLDYMNRLGQKKVPKLPSKEKETSTKQTASPKSNSHSVSTSTSPSSSFNSEVLYTVSEDVMWVNAFAGRLLYDVLRDSFWLSKIQEKFQRKLSAIKLPYFMEELVISHIDFGETIPLIQGASKPVLNENGIWADLDIIYDGHFRVTIDTKLNLMKLKKAQATLDEAESNSLLSVSNSNVSVPSISPTTDVFQGSPSDTIQKSAIFDSDVEDSAESSSEEFDVSKTGPVTLPDVTPSSPGNTASHKMLRMVDKIAASKYFQQVTEYKYIKRAMEGVSNTNIALVVEVRGLAGTLVLNFPPPPSDRLWYGFRSNPQLLLTAQPKVGDRTISLLHISTWIERRLRREFQKLLVLPNMDDLIIPVMNKERPC